MSLSDKNQFINYNILNSVNSILSSYDDGFVLSAIYNDILDPVIDETVKRKKNDELVNINTYLKKPHGDNAFKNIYASFIDGTDDPIDEINDGDHEKHNLINKYPNYFQSAQYMLTKEKDVPNTMEPFNKASYSATQNYLPIRDTVYGVRMRKGIDKMMTSIPAWQSALQLVATGLLVMILPGFLQFG